MMIQPAEAFEAMKGATECAVDVAVLSCLLHMRDCGYTKEQAEEYVDEALAAISKGMPDTIADISQLCCSMASSEPPNGDRAIALRAMSSTAYASFAHLGAKVGEQIVVRNAKGGAA